MDRGPGAGASVGDGREGGGTVNQEQGVVDE
jgi:hypothetical protein